MKVVGTLEVYLQNTGVLEKDSWLDKILSGFQTEVEDEFYTLLHYLKQIHSWLSAKGITNIIQLSLDQEIHYNDPQNQTEDFGLALETLLKKKISDGEHFTLILEEETPTFQTILQVKFSDKHKKGEAPLVLTYLAIPIFLLQEKEELLETYQTRIQSFFKAGKEFAKKSEALKKEVEQRLASLSEKISDYLEIKKLYASTQIQFHHNETEHFFSYQTELWERIHLLTQLTAKRDDSTKEISIPTWAEYSKRKVFNPKTGRIVQIRSLPTPLQIPYREAYVLAGGSLNKTLKTEEDEGFFTSFFSMMKSGLDFTSDKIVQEMQEEAPRTHAFVTNEDYRSAVLKEGQRRIGMEIYDTADLLATTLVNELLEMRHIPKAWSNITKQGEEGEKEREEQEKGVEQILDMGEFLVGTLVPITAFSVGGPLGGLLGLGLVYGLAKSIEYNEDRPVSIALSAYTERKKEIQEKRKEDRLKTKIHLVSLRDGVIDPEDIQELERIKQSEIPKEKKQSMVKEFSERFKSYGKKLVSGEVQLKMSDEELKQMRQVDILNALNQESHPSSEILIPDSLKEVGEKIEQIELPTPSLEPQTKENATENLTPKTPLKEAKKDKKN